MTLQRAQELLAKLEAIIASPPEAVQVGAPRKRDSRSIPEKPMTVIDIDSGGVYEFWEKDRSDPNSREGWYIDWGRHPESTSWFNFFGERLPWVSEADHDHAARYNLPDQWMALVREASCPDRGCKIVYADIVFTQGGFEYACWLTNTATSTSTISLKMV